MTDKTDYIYWLRDMAEREEMSIRPCPKALRRAADAWEKDKQTIQQVRELPKYDAVIFEDETKVVRFYDLLALIGDKDG